MRGEMANGLNDLKVVEISRGIAGGYCGRLCSGWGAEVIKVEPPGAGDNIRRAGPFREDIPDPETSALHLYLDTGKKSVTLDFTAASGADLLRQLLRDTDVLVDSATPGLMAKLGLGYESLAELNPRLVMTAITWFGQNGPYAGYAADDLVAYAMGGQMYVNGQPEREPLNAGFAAGEYIGGLYGYIGTMLALQRREQSGRGQMVDVSIFECLAGSHQFTLTWPAYSGVMLERPGWPGSRAPLSLYRCADGYVNLRLQNIEMSFLAQLLSMPELAEDPRFSTYAARIKNIRELEALVIAGIAGLKKQAVFRMAGEWRQLCGYVATPADLLTDPQYQFREFWEKVPHPAAGELLYPGAPVKMTDTEWKAERAPLMGEHNIEIFGGRLGYASEDLVRLRELGVI